MLTTLCNSIASPLTQSGYACKALWMAGYQHQQQFRMLADEYRSRLFETGSFNTLEEMAEALTAIAANRYSDAPIRAAAN